VGNSLKKRQNRPESLPVSRVHRRKGADHERLIDALHTDVLKLTDSEVDRMLGLAIGAEEAASRLARAAGIAALLGLMSSAVPRHTQDAIGDLSRIIFKRGKRKARKMPAENLEKSIDQLRRFVERKRRNRSNAPTLFDSE
jgi:hypothetical protein